MIIVNIYEAMGSGDISVVHPYKVKRLKGYAGILLSIICTEQRQLMMQTHFA